MNKHTAELLEKHFDVAFAAPDGIKKLRELILTLAMQGKLVPQDPNEQPACELLKEIEAEKQRLLKEGRIKKPKPLPPVTEEEKSYALPQGWEWVKLGTLASYKYGKTPPSKNPIYWMSEDGGFPWISISDLPIRGYVAKTAKAVSAEAVSSVFKCEPIPAGSLLMSFKLSIGKTAITKIDAYHNEAIISFIGLGQGLKFWLFWVLYPVANSGKSKKAIKGSTLNSESIGDLLIPLPPSAEQHRIVAKIDELMARCDELEKLRTAQQRARLTVHASAIKQLLNIAKPDQHQRAQAFLAEHFGELYTVKENVAELRKAILQLAVMGKLVPQNPDDQPASELLKEIEVEKQRLVKEGKIKKPKPWPPVAEEEKPYALPQGWEWVRVWAVSQLITSGSRDWAKYYSESGATFVTMGNLSRGNYQLRLEEIRYVNPPRDGEGARTRLEENDLLISITGDVGNLGLIPDDFGEAYINQHTCLLRFMSCCRGRFFPELMRSPFAKAQFDAPQRGIKNSFRLGDVGEMIVPLPPILEQHRIVEKIDEIMALCDSLEQQIGAAARKQAELLNTLFNAQPQADIDKVFQPASPSSARIIDLADYRASIGCYAINKLATAQYFGRTAAAKVMYLAHAYIGLDLDLKPEREAAGPLDTWIYDFERQGQDKRWFEVNEKTLVNGKKKTEYRCLTALSEPAAKAEALMTPGQKAEFDRLIYTLADKKTEEVEIIATLFAVWNDFLIDGVQPTDTQIISDVRENWHERKARFTPAELGRWLDWLRRESIIPKGRPPRTVQQSRLGLD
ncbi:restriction endonuclease subunit S [Achromobacter sp. ACRQX]|uniref:restriction endonuclease subunit S n=1 Tax=Achromobacter sp. ACRQX TaxID=2918181 RepID=UPI001EF261FF|nr:restriction endonuclease subunit S [Achromobacter sp. ACRQX]MCG7324073.1 restriction endonuclease subunit S [Achromobacter sp. ACRQX]